MKHDFAADAGLSHGLPDFISYHLFGSAPEQSRRAMGKARGLALGAAPAGSPPVATIVFGAPIAAPGQCGVTVFTVCRPTANGVTGRCP